MLMINSLKFLSAVWLLSSQTTKKRSKRDIIGADSWMLFFSDFDLSYLPKIGFAAANIEVLALRVA